MLGTVDTLGRDVAAAVGPACDSDKFESDMTCVSVLSGLKTASSIGFSVRAAVEGAAAYGRAGRAEGGLAGGLAGIGGSGASFV